MVLSVYLIEKIIKLWVGFTVKITDDGRAFDGALKLFYEPSPKFRISLGYRTVEGSADVESVYNFPKYIMD